MEKEPPNRVKIVYGDNAVNEKGERIGIVFHCLRHTRTINWVEMGFFDDSIRWATGPEALRLISNMLNLILLQ